MASRRLGTHSYRVGQARLDGRVRPSGDRHSPTASRQSITPKEARRSQGLRADRRQPLAAQSRRRLVCFREIQGTDKGPIRSYRSPQARVSPWPGPQTSTNCQCFQAATLTPRSQTLRTPQRSAADPDTEPRSERMPCIRIGVWWGITTLFRRVDDMGYRYERRGRRFESGLRLQMPG